jgi:hypothetical protein
MPGNAAKELRFRIRAMAALPRTFADWRRGAMVNFPRFGTPADMAQRHDLAVLETLKIPVVDPVTGGLIGVQLTFQFQFATQQLE